jgi:putative hydrolase of the HAD superfamily
VTRPRALLFDLDDTLLDWSGMGAAVARTAEFVAAARPGLDAAMLAAANAAVWTTFWPEVELDWMLGKRESPWVQREAWRRSLLACGVDDTELTDLAQETFAREDRASHRLYDDARPLLAALGNDYLLAVITNGARDTQREKLQVVGLERAFGAVAISAEVGFAKPDPLIFRYALNGLGVSADAAWHIGDSLPNDVGGAKAAGVRAIWLNRTAMVRSPETPEPDAEIQGLGQLLDLLDR